MNVIRHHNKIIIGGSLEALSYGIENDIPIFFIEPKVPFFFEKTKEGKSKEVIWRELAFYASLSGLLPAGSRVSSLRVTDENILRVATENNKLFKYEFGEILIFDYQNINGVEFEKKDESYMVLDWVNVRSGMKHEHNYLEDKDSSFVNKIHFFKSDRIDGDHDKKDLVSISYMTKKQLDSIEYSDTFVKFKVVDMMKQAGIKGRRNGRRPDDRTRFIHLSIRVEPVSRDIVDVSEYALREQESIVQMKEKNFLIKDIDFRSNNSYIKKITQLL